MLFWGDIVRAHAELVPELPREGIVALAWHYEAPQDPALLPDAVRAGFQWLFPYWAIGGSIEIWTGRAGFDHWMRGMITVACSALVLEIVRRIAWKRGLLRYGGSGM